ncbi:antitoxin VbhA family protein [Hymenobacter arizonensis]|uniref:Antitoxin VbhA domain-containing protein n=1 Tax=Hymenobacter arizonensis TaxID=1227077 RepID=A0A1I6BHI0_HYMAR|nr:antitoxin VbhA family protein [Hymenobacter arizonensis]SFQ80237.1 hypothetical protein SAMN04515668_4557 [Hymenobacter arizonensis]
MHASTTVHRYQVVRPILTGNNTYFSGMEKPTFLPQEATEAQRRAIMQRTFAAGIAQGAIVTAETEAAYNRYIAGEITLEQATNLAMSVYQKQAVHA